MGGLHWGCTAEATMACAHARTVPLQLMGPKHVDQLMGPKHVDQRTKLIHGDAVQVTGAGNPRPTGGSMAYATPPRPVAPAIP